MVTTMRKREYCSILNRERRRLGNVYKNTMMKMWFGALVQPMFPTMVTCKESMPQNKR